MIIWSGELGGAKYWITVEKGKVIEHWKIYKTFTFRHQELSGSGKEVLHAFRKSLKI